MSEERLTTQLVDGPVPRLEHAKAELRVENGPDKGARYEIGVESLLIGSASDCQVVLHDSTVSARHAEITLRRGVHVIRDLGAKNGTRLGGTWIESAPLVVGAKIQLGTCKLAVVGQSGVASVELSQPGVFGELVAHSVAMRAVVANLERLAPSDATLLIEGETGTGKDVVARTTHELSARRDGPFVVFDCGSVPANLIAAELFGTERGAFTGSAQARPGLLETAEGGTLFLDEVGELPLELQPTLLRTLEARRTRRIGGSSEIAHDVRFIVATNRNLAEEVRAQRFRADLFYRLAVARLRLPALRERREDIPVLAQHFASQFGLELSPELLVALAAYEWPGNIRELRNAVERAQLQQGRAALLELGAQQSTSLVPLADARRLASERFEREYVAAALTAAGGNVTRAAELAGVSRQVMTQLASKHGLRGRDRRD